MARVLVGIFLMSGVFVGVFNRTGALGGVLLTLCVWLEMVTSSSNWGHSLGLRIGWPGCS